MSEKPDVDPHMGDAPTDLEVTALVEGEGAEAKPVIADGAVRVNGEVETRRGRQLAAGDVVTLGGQAARVATGEVEIDVPW